MSRAGVESSTHIDPGNPGYAAFSLLQGSQILCEHTGRHCDLLHINKNTLVMIVELRPLGQLRLSECAFVILQ